MFIKMLEFLPFDFTVENLLTFVVVLLLLVIFKLNVIIDFFESRQKSRLEKIKNAIENTSEVEKDLLAFYADQYSIEQFRLIEGFSPQIPERDEMIKVCKASNGRLAMVHFKRAWTLLGFDGKTILVKIGIKDEISAIIFKFAGLMSMIFGVLLASQLADKTLLGFITILALALFFIGIALVFIYLTFPFYSAKRVKKELENQSKEKKKK
ncbi:hypothetical protein [Aliivibrio fischeri]|uniref:hypothetical protein n=1 Tax=Aliivibrio fischeri TaxID=668 RepID=UPI0007C51C05|nr:hypothetical protein [Aliivibrio fischeri]MCE7556368.1 hypothetical protein [Aliivibrio fischeri]MCE7563067.1 hypothetical protein [Aliivibrio fischeri]MCE7571359.1 hypothetical protein [Aliivibrio fischeri]TGA68281.1 hypothetical protein VFES401_15495 [Aliivibrio fischeri]